MLGKDFLRTNGNELSIINTKETYYISEPLLGKYVSLRKPLLELGTGSIVTD